MGWAKRMHEEQQDQGWDFSDKHVCVRCVDDYALKAAISDDSRQGDTCDFCGLRPAAPLDSLLKIFVVGLRNEYENALDSVSWDSSEGGFQAAPVIDTWDLISDMGDVLVNDALLSEVRSAVHDITWVDRDFALVERDQALSDAWAAFCWMVKHQTRYVFWRRLAADGGADEEPGSVSPLEILDRVGALVERIGIVKEISEGMRLWRARIHTGFPLIAKELGTVPPRFAITANRMSPAGIPQFYGTEDMETAIQEVSSSIEKASIAVGEFSLTKTIRVLDFTGLPPTPSMFDPVWGAFCPEFRFLHRFVDDISKPIEKFSGPIEYVPTQIVSEYFLQVFNGGLDIAGIKFKSSLTGAANFALNVSNDACIDESNAQEFLENPQLKLISNTARVIER